MFIKIEFGRFDIKFVRTVETSTKLNLGHRDKFEREIKKKAVVVRFL